MDETPYLIFQKVIKAKREIMSINFTLNRTEQYLSVIKETIEQNCIPIDNVWYREGSSPEYGRSLKKALTGGRMTPGISFGQNLQFQNATTENVSEES